MDKLYIEVATNICPEKMFTTVSSFISLYVYTYLKKPTNVEPTFVRSYLKPQRGLLQLYKENLSHIRVIDQLEAVKYEINNLRLPVYTKDDTFIAGLCAVCRELVIGQPNKTLKYLLGFKGSCLLAPSEVSIWTRFCEVNMIETLENLLAIQADSLNLEKVPLEAVRFEYHMKEPVRVHNIFKLARNETTWANKQKNELKDQKLVKENKNLPLEYKIPKENLPIKHKYVEGVSFTLADVILYPCLRILYHICYGMLNQFPLTKAWFEEVEKFDITSKVVLENICYFPKNTKGQTSKLLIPTCKETSLYKRDTKRYKPRHRLYTEQAEVNAVLEKLKDLKLDFRSDCSKTFADKIINWAQIEPDHIENSALPPNRLQRKRQQLENMANAIVSLALVNNRIVDFCSGTGHLGILLALQLPQCTIILVENKTESLNRAKKRANKLKLRNMKFYQCNIDYFEGHFDIGTSLHACGTATDVVLKQCQRVNAKFVCCSCCYGALQVMPHIKYPLSQRFSKILSSEEYMFIAHTADQAHPLGTLNCREEITQQGQLCMDIIETDRKLQAEEVGYKVQLTRLQPESCTPKNRLLIGMPTLHTT